jgi:cell division septation protein DedD
MQKHHTSQLEMFTFNDKGFACGRGASGREDGYLEKVRRYQKLVLWSIVVLFLSIFSFSLGVEKGKKIGMSLVSTDTAVKQKKDLSYEMTLQIQPQGSLKSPPEQRMDSASQMAAPTQKPQPAALKASAVLVKKPLVSPSDVPKEATRPGRDSKPSTSPGVGVKPGRGANYTIQVASISRAENAKRELTRLKNKGYSAFSLSKGKYIVICVGRFGAKEEAAISAQKLKSRYPDCIIRRL